MPQGPPDDRFVYLSDVLPTAWQAVEYAAVPAGGSLVVLGLGPIGDMCTADRRSTAARTRSSASTWCPNGWSGPAASGVRVLDLQAHGKNLADDIRDLTGGRGPDAVIDAVGMEAHGAPAAKLAQQADRRCCPARCPPS